MGRHPELKATTRLSYASRPGLLGAGLVAILAWGCASKAMVHSAPDAEILMLSETYSIRANLGKGPVEVDERENPVRYAFQRGNQPLEYLLIVFPDLLDGEIKLALKGQEEEAKDSLVSQARFVDRVMRAHRLLLQARLDEAKALIGRIEDEYDVTSGTASLAATLALLDGQRDAARQLMRYAKELDGAGATEAAAGSRKE